MSRRLQKAAMLLAVSCVGLTVSISTLAQEAGKFPVKPVTIVVPFPPGGATDTLARLLGAGLSEEWKQPVIVENRAGASGMIGNAFVARAAPDGYTLLIGISQLVQAPALYDKLQYDVVADFTPISKLIRTYLVFATSPNVEFKSVKEYVTLAAKNPGRYSFGSYGMATTSHIYAEIFNKRQNVKSLHVPYKGAGPLLTDMMGGRVDYTFMESSSVVPHVQAGKLKVLAITGEKRSPSFPNVPTFTELGYTGPGLDSSLTWIGMLGPGKMPPDLTTSINNAVVRVLQTPVMQKKMAELGMVTDGSSAEHFGQAVPVEVQTWKTLVKEGGVTLE